MTRPDLRGAGYMRKGGVAATRAHNESERSAAAVEVTPVASVPAMGEAGARMRAGRLWSTDRLACLGAVTGFTALVVEFLHVLVGG